MRKASAALHRRGPYELLLHALDHVSAASPSFLRQMHALILTSGLQRKSVLACKLITGYGRLPDLLHARKSFETMPERNTRALNCVLKVHIDGRELRSALELYLLSLSVAETIPNAMTFSLILRGCTDLGWSRSGVLLHAHLLVSGSEPDLHLGTDLVRFYLRSGRLDDARKMFGLMSERDLILWTAMVDGLLRSGSHGEALCFFSEMRASGIRANAAAWNALIAGFARHGHASEALLHFRLMQLDEVLPDQATLCIILPLLSRSAAALRSSAAAHGYAVRRYLAADLSVTSALLDMYSKNGRLDLAWRLFNLAGERDTGLWNAMILALAVHGDGDQAVLLLRRMLVAGAKPNEITFTAALSACNHAGMVDEGRRIFQAMVFDHGISPSGEHFSCLVDLLGRAGRLDEAFTVIASLPAPPSEDVWGAVLAACRTHSDAVSAAKLAIVSGAGDRSGGRLATISNIFAEAGRWEDVARVRILMRDAGAKKTTACSWIELAGRVHAFKVFDHLHPQKDHIYAVLRHLEANTCTSEVDNPAHS